MGQFVEFVCGKCGHEQTINWGEGFRQLDQLNCVDHIHKPEGLSQEINLILKNKTAYVENLQWMGYYCPVCHTWDNFLNFSIRTNYLTCTPRYLCKKFHVPLRPVAYRNHEKKPWKCEKCGSSGPKTTMVGCWD